MQADDTERHENEFGGLGEICFRFGDWAEDIEAFVDRINRLPGHTDKDISNRTGFNC